MKIALVYSSKMGMSASFLSKRLDDGHEEEDDPPPDLLAECDSDETIQAIREALEEKFFVIPVEADNSAFSKLRRTRPDLVFNIAERLEGPSRESHIPTLCEMLDIPYTGSDPLTLGICLDKSRTKEILSYHRIPNPSFWTVDDPARIPAEVGLPAIVKPLYEGSSKGIKNSSVVDDRAQLWERVSEISGRYRQPAIIERFLPGREFTVGVLGNSPDWEILPIVEIDHSLLPPGARPIYSFEAKWVWDTPDKPLDIFKCPADISPDLAARIGGLVRKTCDALRIRDWCRIDVRLDEEGCPQILEVNPLPGILPNPEDNSCLPKAARTAGYSYSGLLHRVVDGAVRRYGLNGTGQVNEQQR
jgi:D-alanine-D-alanine ligase